MGYTRTFAQLKSKYCSKTKNSQPSSILKRQKRMRFMDVPEEHVYVYQTTNREEAAMNKNRENPYPGLKKDKLERLFRQERKREEDSVFTQVLHLTGGELCDPPATLPESEDEPNNSSNKTKKETDPGTTHPETNSTVEPETSNPLKDRISRV